MPPNKHDLAGADEGVAPSKLKDVGPERKNPVFLLTLRMP